MKTLFHKIPSSPWLGVVAFLLGTFLLHAALQYTHFCFSPSWRDWAHIPGLVFFLGGAAQFFIALVLHKHMPDWVKGLLGFGSSIIVCSIAMIALLGTMFSDTGVIKHYQIEEEEYCLLSQNGGFGKSGLWLRLYDMNHLDHGYIADYFSEGLNDGEQKLWMESIPLYYTTKEKFVLKRKPFSAPICNPRETQQPCRDFPYTLER